MEILSTPQGWTAFDFPGRLGKVNFAPYFDWLGINVQASIVPCGGIPIILQVSLRQHPCRFMTEVTQGLDWDDLTQTNGIFRISSEGHEGWSKWVDTENGNYDYLLGIDVCRPIRRSPHL
jgi:hypothetical protein